MRCLGACMRLCTCLLGSSSVVLLHLVAAMPQSSDADEKKALACSCVWCHRKFDDPHPWDSVRQKNPEAKLPRRAPRARECRICNDFLLDAHPREVADAKCRKSFIAILERQPDRFDEFTRARKEWESRRATSQRLGRPTQVMKKKVKIKAVSSKAREFRTRKGVWWPKALYESPSFFNKKLKPAKVDKHNGRKGIILGSNAWPFVPDGCVEIYELETQAAVKDTVAYEDSSEGEIREGLADDVWDMAKERVGMSRISWKKLMESHHELLSCGLIVIFFCFGIIVLIFQMQTVPPRDLSLQLSEI